MKKIKLTKELLTSDGQFIDPTKINEKELSSYAYDFPKGITASGDGSSIWEADTKQTLTLKSLEINIGADYDMPEKLSILDKLKGKKASKDLKYTGYFLYTVDIITEEDVFMYTDKRFVKEVNHIIKSTFGVDLGLVWSEQGYQEKFSHNFDVAAPNKTQMKFFKTFYEKANRMVKNV